MNCVQHAEAEKLDRDWSAACNAMRRLLMFFHSPHLTSIWVFCCENIGPALNVGEGGETETAALDR